MSYDRIDLVLCALLDVGEKRDDKEEGLNG